MKDNKCIRVFADKVQIDRCKSRLEDVDRSVKALSRALSLAGNEVRLSILFLLYEEGRLCVCDMSDVLDMKIPAISQHLRKMKDGDIVRNEKEGQTIFYSLTPDYHDLFESFFSMISKDEILQKVG